MDRPYEDTTLVLENVRIDAPGGRALLHVPKATFAVGKLHVVIGPNGAGKTSLLRGIAGVYPGAGRITLGRAAFASLLPAARSRLVAYQPQGRPRSEGLTVAEFVYASRSAAASWFRGLTGDDRKRCDAALARCGVAALRGRLLTTLSGGEAARVALASTLAQGASHVLLDEPAAAADIVSAFVMYSLFREIIADMGLTLIVVEHDLGLARGWADEIHVVSRGRLLASGAPDDIFSDGLLDEVYGGALRHVEVAPRVWASVATGQATLKPSAEARA